PRITRYGWTKNPRSSCIRTGGNLAGKSNSLCVRSGPTLQPPSEFLASYYSAFLSTRRRRHLSGAPSTGCAAPNQPRAYPLFQKRSGTEALTIGFLHDFLGLKTQTRRRRVHQLERTDRMAEPQPAGSVDVLGRRDPLLDQPHRFDQEHMQHAIYREASDVLDTDRCLADTRADPQSGCDRRLAGVEAVTHLHEPHAA